MAKIRLNKEKREILRELAAKVIAETPIEKETEIRLKKAHKEHARTFKALCAQAKKELAKAVPQEHIDVCAKYGHTRKNTRIMFMNLDTRTPFEVSLVNMKIYDKEHDPAGTLRCSFKYDERTAYAKDWYAHVAEQEVVFIQKAKGTQQNGIPASDTLLKKNAAFKEAVDELGVASRLDSDLRASISRDFEALIAGSRTFEDVVAIWPEAKKVTPEIVGSSQQISLVSSEAINRIQENMASRGVKEEAKTDG